MININEFKNYLNCDNVFLESVIKKFIEEVTDISLTIKKAADKEEWAIVKSNAHKMLSSVRIFEMNELILLLEQTEINAETPSNSKQLNSDIKKLIPLVEKAILDMQKVLKELN